MAAQPCDEPQPITCVARSSTISSPAVTFGHVSAITAWFLLVVATAYGIGRPHCNGKFGRLATDTVFVGFSPVRSTIEIVPSAPLETASVLKSGVIANPCGALPTLIGVTNCCLDKSKTSTTFDPPSAA